MSPDGFEIDNSELSKLSADLGAVPPRSGKKLRQALEVTARNVKDAWAEKLEDSASLPHASRTITYDISGSGNRATGSQLEAEVGPELPRKQARFVGIVEYGSVSLPPRGYGHASLQENEADFERGINKAIDETLRDLGL